MTTITDVLIIGGSYAGLAAAQTLYRHGHSVTIIDYAAHRPQPPLRLVPGFEASSGVALREASRKELAQFAGDLVKFEDDVEVSSVKRIKQDEQNIFEVADTSGRTYLGRILLLAAGAVDEQPDVQGYAKCWPQRIFHCLFTFGQELRGAGVAALWARDGMAEPMHAAMLAGDALKIAKRAVILTNGRDGFEEGVRAIIERMGGSSWIENVSFEPRPVTGLKLVGEGTEQKIVVTLGDEDVVYDFLVHQPKKRQALPHILEELGIELDPRGDIKTVNPFGGTTAPGVYAAGDTANLFKIVPAAIFSGAAAGAGVARALGPGVVRERFGIDQGHGAFHTNGHTNGTLDAHV